MQTEFPSLNTYIKLNNNTIKYQMVLKWKTKFEFFKMKECNMNNQTLYQTFFQKMLIMKVYQMKVMSLLLQLHSNSWSLEEIQQIIYIIHQKNKHTRLILTVSLNHISQGSWAILVMKIWTKMLEWRNRILKKYWRIASF